MGTTDELTLRPSGPARAVGWTVVVVGLALASSGFTQPGDTEALVVVLCAGVVFAGVGLGLATAVAHVTTTGIRYRNGLIRRSIPADLISGITVGPGSGAAPPRLAFIVHTEEGRSIRLIGVQRWKSTATAADMASVATRAEVIVGAAGPGSSGSR